MVECHVLNAVGVSLQRPLVVARVEVPHLDGGVLASRGHQAVDRVEQHLAKWAERRGGHSHRQC